MRGLLADRGYDANWIGALVAERDAWANIPPKRNRKAQICSNLSLWRPQSDFS